MAADEDTFFLDASADSRSVSPAASPSRGQEVSPATRSLLQQLIPGGNNVETAQQQRRTRPRRLALPCTTTVPLAGSAASRSRPAQRLPPPRRPGFHRSAAVPGEPSRGLRPRSAPRRRAPIAGRRARAAPRAGSVPRRPATREARPTQPEPRESNCYAYCLADTIECQRLNVWWLQHSDNDGAAMLLGEGIPGWENEERELQLVLLSKDILLLKLGRKDCFIFGSGCLVSWGCTVQEVRAAQRVVKDFLRSPLAPQDVDEDHVGVADDEGRPPELCFSCREPPIFERLALAYALAQSVRLGSLELRIERSIAQTRTIPETLARTGHVHLSSRRVTQMIGELFALRSQVNLETDILDTPEFFWDYEDSEELYLAWRQYLDMDHRVSILNQRFEVVQDLFDFLESELNERKAEWLEWVIILIVACDVLVMAFRLYFRYSRGGHEHTEVNHHGLLHVHGLLPRLWRLFFGFQGKT